MLILGIETSCDETAVALYHSEKGLLADDIYTQMKTHEAFGGVVPELASRDHVRKLSPMLKSLLKESGYRLQDLEGVAYTAGPGLIGALLVGTAFGRSLAYALGVPAIGVNHMEGHLLAPLLAEPKPSLPFLALLVSGGHTQLVSVEALGQYKILGESLDDAAGEAFDKTAKLLGLPYPGGPHLAKLAQKGDPSRFQFPRPMCDRPSLAFSFSGLKTSVLNSIHKQANLNEQTKADIAAGFQEAVVDSLVWKCQRALKTTGLKRLVVAGGVSANSLLRERIKQLETSLGIEVFYPPLRYCTDNAAMIAYAGCQRLLRGEGDDLAIDAKPRWPLQVEPTSLP